LAPRSALKTLLGIQEISGLTDVTLELIWSARQTPIFAGQTKV